MSFATRYLWLVGLPLFLSACVTVRHCPIETLQPAKVTLEGSKKNILICAPHTLLQEAIATNNLTDLPTDSLISNILISLQHLWKETPGYEDAQITFQIFTDEFSKIPNSDMMVLLQRLQIKNTYYGQEYSYVEWEAYLFVNYMVNWAILDSSGTLLDEYTERNLMDWHSGMRTRKIEAVSHLPEVKDAWWDMGIVIARNYAARILPRWQTDMRDIYMINKFPELSRQAHTAMLNNGYARAFDVWENMLMQCRKRGQKKTKSRIFYNMAVSWEFQNQLDEAIFWVERSEKLKSKPQTVHYLKLLRERKREQIKLDRQVVIE